MMIGYVYQTEDSNCLVEQVTSLKEYQVDRIILEPFNQKNKHPFQKLIDEITLMNEGDKLVIEKLEIINQPLFMFNEIFEKLENKKIKIIIIRSLFVKKEHLEIFKYLVKKEFELSTQQIKRKNSQKNSSVGRPGVSQEKIKEINEMYQLKKYPYKEIARRCNVSLATVQKYIEK